MKNINNLTIWKYLVLCIISIVFIGCGGGKCNTNSANQTSNLSISVPTSYPAGMAVDVPVVVNNNGIISVSGLHYAVINDTTAGNVTITPDSAKTCLTIPAGQHCTLMAHVASTSHAGSFTIAVNDASANKTTLSTTYKLTSNVIGLVQKPVATTESGGNGIATFYPNQVVANESGVTQVIITAFVNSTNIGNYTNIILTDSAGNPLPSSSYSVVSSNVNNNLTTNSIVSFLVNIPAGSSQFQFNVATTQNGNNIAVANNSQTIVITNSQQQVGILAVAPNYFTLNAGYESQIITLSNTGNSSLTSLNVTPNSPLEKVTSDCGSQLAAGASCRYIVTFNKNSEISGTTTILFDYNDGQQARNSTATVNYQGIIPLAGLEITSSNSNFDFATRTNTPTQTNIVTLKNTGSVAESNFQFTNLPNYFSINTTNIANPCTHALAPQESCSVNLVYTNNLITPETTATIVLNYTYGKANISASSNIALTYQTLQSQAILALQQTTQLNSIYNNNSESSSARIVVTNTGDESATSLTPLFAGTDAGLFNILANGCSSNLAPNSSESCIMQFGPASSSVSAGTKNATFNLSYIAYPSAQTTIATLDVAGIVNTAQSAVISESASGNSGFSSGNGTSATPYTVDQNAAAPTVTYTITNTGSVDATSFYISGTPSAGWTIATNNCGTNLSKVTLAANTGSCTITLSLSTSTATTRNLDISSLTANWIDQDSPSGQTQALSGTIYATVNSTALPANIVVNNVSTTGFISNSESDGTSAAPLALKYNANQESTATLSIQYQNSGGSDATGFTSNLAIFPSGWSLDTHGCNNITLTKESGNSCTDVYKFSSNAESAALQKVNGAYPTNFNSSNIKFSWNDGTSHSNQSVDLPAGTHNTNNIVYTNYFLTIFVSNTTHNANFATAIDITGAQSGKPIYNADMLCANDSNKPNDGYIYKALIAYGNDLNNVALGEKRFACGGNFNTGICSGPDVTSGYDWVLQPSYVQYRSDNSNNLNIVGTTDATYGYIYSYKNNFGTAASTIVWTGLSNTGYNPSATPPSYNYNWMSPESQATGNLSCTGWTDSDSDNRGRVADAGGLPSYNRIYSLNVRACNSTYALYCVQQLAVQPQPPQ